MTEAANQASSAATEKTEESLLPRAVVEESLLPSAAVVLVESLLPCAAVEESSVVHIGASASRVVLHIMPNRIWTHRIILEH